VDTNINASQERMETAMTSIWTEFEETIESRVEGAWVTVALNGLADQQNVATAWSVYNINPAASTPKVKSVASRQLQKQQHEEGQDGYEGIMW
jgi:hypothetical protein